MLVKAPLNAIADVELPLHKVWLATAVTVGVGSTVIVKDFELPVHPLFVGVTVIVAVTGAVPLFAAVKVVISPALLDPRPIEVVLFAQL